MARSAAAVFAFQWFDLGLDERVHLGEQARKMVWQSEIHGDLLSCPARGGPVIYAPLPQRRQLGSGAAEQPAVDLVVVLTRPGRPGVADTARRVRQDRDDPGPSTGRLIRSSQCSTSMPRARSCGSCTTSATVLIGPAITPAADRLSMISAGCLSAAQSPMILSSSSWLRPRAPCVANRSSVLSSGRPMASQSRRNTVS